MSRKQFWLLMLLYFVVSVITNIIVSFLNVVEQVAINNLVLTILTLIIFRKELISSGKKFINNFQSNIKLVLKYLLLLLGITIFSNILIMFFTNLLSMKYTLNKNTEILNTIGRINPAILFFSAVIHAPLFEEIVFRFGVFKVLSTKNIKLAYIVSNSVFVLLHFVYELISHQFSILLLFQLIPYIVLSILITRIYHKTDNIWFPILLHALNNLFGVIIIFLQL